MKMQKSIKKFARSAAEMAVTVLLTGLKRSMLVAVGGVAY